ncbi:hypothetical protein BACCIP111895_02270 [Neobacillus rhizosphaerae]|uniref:Uncharacterized protein n=1 Tax=Neobacillus rhizosphaerae TaxID=2880965 RepID=A0ABM9ER49_9BACI|nr:hypothetical protein [Neobacillus rhizosphaerae]CAH2715086.1 hypothetical protein BACCIP111895_02270 [Neobacillus rhizosphaerae]
MLKKILSLIPDFIIFVQAFITFLVPLGFFKLFKWIHSLEKE